MKNSFYIMVSDGNGSKKLQTREGDYDDKHKVFYHKESDGWTVTDMYTGVAVPIAKKPKKKDVESQVEVIYNKLKQIRASENYLQTYINFRELVEKENK